MDQVLKILHDQIEHPAARQWCDDLVEGDLDCKRLAICLAIELRKPNEEVLLREHLDEIFNDCQYDHDTFLTNDSYPRLWFEKRRKVIWHQLCNEDFCILPTANPIDGSCNKNDYVTVLDFYTLSNHYIRQLGGDFNIDDYNVDSVVGFVRDFPDFLDKVGFFGGPTRPVWVTTSLEINRIKSQNSSYNEPTNVMNCLGLCIRHYAKEIFPYTWNMYFRIEYPNPSGVTAFQPSSLNKDWQNAEADLYLSYIKKDSFGLTYAADASGNSAKEQIHHRLKKPIGLRIYYIGQHGDLKTDKSKILDEGIKRLQL